MAVHQVQDISSRMAAAMVQKAIVTVWPRGICTRRRRLKTGIEHGAGAVGQRPAFRHRRRRRARTCCASGIAAVGFILHVADRIAFDDAQMGRPDRLVPMGLRGRRVARSAPVSRRYSVSHKQLGEGRMRIVIARPRQRQLGIRGDLDLAQAVPLLVMEMRRTSESSSGETSISVTVASDAVRRRMLARSSEKSPR